MGFDPAGLTIPLQDTSPQLASTMATDIPKYDSIIIGSGQAGMPLSITLARARRKTVLIEREHIGGCCINEGCTPTKTLVATGRIAYLTRRCQRYGVHMCSSLSSQASAENDVIIDMARVRQRRRDIVTSFRDNDARRMAGAGVEILMGEASFVDSHTLKVRMTADGSERLVQGQTIFINTGARPAPPPLSGLETVDQRRILDSTAVQELDAVPQHLAVIGGGYVGVEFAQFFHRLGARVTLIQRNTQVLPQEDPEIADVLQQILREDGMTVYLDASTRSVAPSSESPDKIDIAVRFKNGDTTTVTGCTHILYASGRVPNTDRLNLGAAGVETDKKGYIVINDFLQTSAPHIYALGDVKGAPAFTHIAYDDFRIIRANLVAPAARLIRLSTKDRVVPYVVYTDPQLAHVGLHEQEAREMFPDKRIMTARMPISYVERALETDEPRGLMKAVVDGETGLILGFSCVATEGGELMSLVEMAMIGAIPYRKMQDAVWAHPTWAESLNMLWMYLQ